MNKKHIVCTQCVMDTSDKDIYFNEKGVCSHCLNFDETYHVSPAQEEENLASLAVKLKSHSAKYDCIVGMSGGVDSSYVAHLAAEMNLNPLVVHLDNGWNSRLAIRNVAKIIDKHQFDLETLIIDWQEFRDLQKAFLRAGVIDIELLTDHAITATLYRLAQKHNIKYILSGVNYATEHGMPLSWNWNKDDKTNIEAIHKQFGEVKLSTFPLISQKKLASLRQSETGPESINVLNLINYSAARAKQELQSGYGWEAYSGKHFESVFTRFYQSYILPVKFGVDKRKVHLSALIRNGEINREQAMLELAKPAIENRQLLRDRDYVIDKLEMDLESFEGLMKSSPVPHEHYASDFTASHQLRKQSGFIANLFKKESQVEKQASALLKHYLDRYQGKTFVIYCAGEIGARTLEQAREKGVYEKIVAVVDNKANHNQHNLGDILVQSPEVLGSLDFEVLLIASHKYQDEIFQNLISLPNMTEKTLIRLRDC
ncbi:N-acetyl sugar amidotransferase [Planctobacterium marinum]|uniref:Asparagine synthetase domain-containing protein n=1 Tax=Planctobacterium marinum TaxID=1631968 RepID=A0AA48KTP1_9ALTE|nr:hypothetical protein MACH26_32800 [Planctobacterium marinum]